MGGRPARTSEGVLMPCTYCSHTSFPNLEGRRGRADTCFSSLPSTYMQEHGIDSPPPTSAIAVAQPSARDDIPSQTSSLPVIPHLLSPAQSSDSAIPTLDGRPQHRMSFNVPSEGPNCDQVRQAGDAGSARLASSQHHIGQQASADSAVQGSSKYFGESSTFDFMTKVCSPGESTSAEPTPATTYPHDATRAATALASSSLPTPFFEGLAQSLGDDELFSLPSRFVADELVDAYFRFSHPLNTYLHEGSFRDRYERLWQGSNLGGVEATENNLAWFGLVNLVFTFGSNHVQVISRVTINHSRFFRRAKTLVFSSLFQAGNIDMVQSLLLIGQYLHSSLELEHAWIVIGLAIRLAQGLGLHLNVGNFTTSVVEQEVRKRVWWGCFVFDRILSMKVGRPPTIHDGSDITIEAPLAIDDEYLGGASEQPPAQPPTSPSKLDFLTHVIAHVRLIDRICKALYSRDQVGFSEQRMTDIPKLLARTIELDGDLTAWKQTLPPHLRPDSDVPGWHFERQRSTLLMRYEGDHISSAIDVANQLLFFQPLLYLFADTWSYARFLYCRVLLHRQILLIYVTRRCPEGFQCEIMYPCIRQCIMAAHETIYQVQLLSQRRVLHAWWHNSHSA